jgi:hypothetical protein
MREPIFLEHLSKILTVEQDQKPDFTNCHEYVYSIGYVFKCATVCAGLKNCRLKPTEESQAATGLMRLDYKSNTYPDPDSFIKARLRQIEILWNKLKDRDKTISEQAKRIEELELKLKN